MEHRQEIHRAGWIVAGPYTVIRNGYMAVENGIIRDVGHGRFAGSGIVVDHGPGAIIPALVNAHTHLELGALGNRLSMENGFREWVKQLIQVRGELGEEVLKKGAESGIAELVRTGCRAVGDISTLDLTRELLAGSGLSGIYFQEFLGGNIPENLSPQGPDSDRISESLAGHAPHTTSPELLRALKAATRKQETVFSIHLDESEDESEFLNTGKGAWADFLNLRGIDFSDWPLPSSGPVQYAESLEILDHRTLAVHLIHARSREFGILRKHDVKICVCPRSNKNLHGRLPDIPGMIRAGLHPALGTDSLASVSSLNLFDEMRFTARAFPDIPSEEIFAMATINGAAALGLSGRFGRLFPGMSARYACIPVTATSAKQLLERMIHETPSEC